MISSLKTFNTKTPSELVMEAKEIFAINMEFGGQLEQAYIHVSEHVLKYITSIDFLKEHNSLNFSDSMKLLKSTREIYFIHIHSGAPSEIAHVNAGKYFIERSNNLANEVETKTIQEEPSPEPLKGKRSLLTSYDSQNSKRTVRPCEDETKFSLEHTGGMNGQDFFWFQHESDEGEISCEYDEDDEQYESAYSDNQSGAIEDYSYDQEHPEAFVSRITTNEEHIKLLKSVIREADNYVVIASYGICIEILNLLKDDIIRLKSKGVGIQFYNSDKKPCSPEVFKFIQDNKICYEVIQTHLKFLTSDRRIAAIGSFNWLSSDSLRYRNGQNGTLVISGEQICSSLSSQILVYMRQYIYKKQERFDDIFSFRNLGTTNTPIYFDLNDGSKLTYLATLDAHRIFIKEAFNIARHSLTICCPFINSSSGFLNDLPREHLAKTANGGVKIRIICRSADVDKFYEAYGDLLKAHRNIELVATEYLHQKTLVVDDHLIADGSFNWMSASRDEESNYHNCELTLVYEGSNAKCLIDEFNKSMMLKEKSAQSDNKKLKLT